MGENGREYEKIKEKDLFVLYKSFVLSVVNKLLNSSVVKKLFIVVSQTVPVMEDSSKPCLPTNNTSTSSGVLRSASDPAITKVTEAWELSLAAASASKDKRVKDVKNTSLKQQNIKKRQTKNETSVISVTDGECMHSI